MRGLRGLLVLGAFGCAEPTEPRGYLTGDWGGDHVGLVVEDGRTTIEFDCATGRAYPILIDALGTFSVQGYYTPGHGGPARDGEELPEYIARYAGHIDGKVLTLWVQVPALSLWLGPYDLIRGSSPRVFKCL